MIEIESQKFSEKILKEANSKKINKKKLLNLISPKELMQLSNVNIYHYIKNLHKHIKKQERKILLLKRKLQVASFKLIVKSPKKETNLDNGEISSNYQTNIVSTEEQDENRTTTSNFIDDIKRTAEAVQNLTGFVYEPTSGLYYDSQTGYYYNAELGLYYDGKLGCYYSFDQEKNQFEFHSQVYDQNEIEEIDSNKDQTETKPTKTRRYSRSSSSSSEERSYRRRDRKKKKKKKKSSKKLKKRKRKSSRHHYQREDGEISSSNDSYSYNHKFQDIAKRYPPSLRIVVQETNLPKIKTGALYLVTYKGGSLGREGDHDVIIPDINISKFHLKFLYNEDDSIYQVKDMGSKNGTILNGIRMSEPQKDSRKMDLLHGSIIIVSQTKLLCHIHDGYMTCEQCEPGLLITNSPTIQSIKIQSPPSHKSELKRIQKKYGIENEKFVTPQNPKDYNDRAGRRRVEVGSSSQHEKTETASIDTSISTQNKGFKLLSKLGWSEGQSLGKNDTGILEPIPLQSNEGKSGLGCNNIVVVPFSKKSEDKKKIWKKTQQRFKNLPDIFVESSDDEIEAKI